MEQNPQQLHHETFTAHSSKRLYMTLSLIVLVTLVGVVSFRLGAKSTPPPPQQISIPPIIQSTPGPTSSEWKTFSSTAKKYTITYPSDWKLDPGSYNSDFYLRKVFSNLGPHANHVITVELKDNPSKLLLNEWIAKNIIEPAVTEYKKEKISVEEIKQNEQSVNGKNIIVVSGAWLPGQADRIAVYVTVGGKVLELIVTPYKSEGLPEEELLQEILLRMAASAKVF